MMLIKNWPLRLSFLWSLLCSNFPRAWHELEKNFRSTFGCGPIQSGGIRVSDLHTIHAISHHFYWQSAYANRQWVKRSAKVRTWVVQNVRSISNQPLESSGAADMVPKKSKKSKSTDHADAAEGRDNILTSMPTSDPAAASATKTKKSSSDNGPVASTKTSRKRAADFMAGDEDVPLPSDSAAPVKKHKTKKTKKGKHDELLSADGVNGVVEHSGDQDLETATSHKPVSTSMQAEAERTVEHELQDEFNGLDEEDGQDDEDDEIDGDDDNAADLLAGFDSDTEDHQKDKDLDLTNTPALPMDKKTRKKLKNLQDTDNKDGPGTVYVGRIPHGFYEKEMKEYFSQFGDISRLRLSRNKRTGASKHFAFIEFKSNEVAKIVANTMDNYLLFGHILKCKYAEPGSLHPDVWKGADKKFRKIPHEKLERQKLAAPKTEQQWQKKVDKEQRRRDLKAKKLKSLGLDMPESILASPSATLQQRLAAEDDAKQVEDTQSTPAGLIEPPTGLPKDEVAVKASKKSNKDKTKKADAAADVETPADIKSKAAKKDTKKTKANTESTEALTQAAEEAPIVEEAKVKTDGKVKKEKKEKKDKKKKGVEQGIDAEPATQTEGEPIGAEDAAESNVQAAAPDAKPAKKEKKNKKKKNKTVEEVVDAEPSTNTAGDAAATEDAAEPNVEEPVSDVKPSKKEKKASKKAAPKPAELEVEEATTADAAESEAEPEDEEEPAMDTNADFISFGAGASDDLPAHKKERKEKKEKKRKERKNLVKARGPKSNLVATKPKNADPHATGRGGIPLLGKDKYNKAKRQEYKEIKKEMLSKRGGRRS